MLDDNGKCEMNTQVSVNNKDMLKEVTIDNTPHNLKIKKNDTPHCCLLLVLDIWKMFRPLSTPCVMHAAALSLLLVATTKAANNAS